MIPVSLKLKNFTSYGENVPELDFTKFQLAVISGTNGVGKSSLLDAITWCVWGWSRAGDSSDDLIRLGQNQMSVEFSFLLEEHFYTVKRQRSKKTSSGTSALELWSGSKTSRQTHNLTEGTIKATQQKIIDLLHLSYETFTNSSFLRQGHADEFTTRGPTERKRILADILGLDHYDSLEEKAKEKIKELLNKLTLLSYQLLEIEAELSQKEQREAQQSEAQKQVDQLETITKSLEKELKVLQKEKETLNIIFEQKNKLEQNLTNQKKELEQIILQGKQRSERIKNLESLILKLPQIEEELKDLKDLKQDYEELQNQRQQKLEMEKQLLHSQSEINIKNQQRAQLLKEIAELNQKLKDLGKPSAKCPTCGQEIDKTHKTKIQTGLNQEITKKQKEISQIQTAKEESVLQKLELDIKKISFDNQKLEKISRQLEQLEKLQQQKEKLLQDSASLETEKRTRTELLEIYKNKSAQIKTLEKELLKLPQITTDLNQLRETILQKEKELEEKRTTEKEARHLLGQATELISRAKQMENLFDKKKLEKESLEKEKEVFEELSLAFGKKGIQAMIIETAIPEIEDEANRLLDRLTEGRMKVSFETQKETKTKVATGLGTKERAIVETLDIIISDEMGERPYELYSGGEAFRVNFAIRLALSKLLTRRAGAKLQFLVVDEGFGTQDAQGRTRIVEVLDTIKNDFEKIVVITHLDELKEEFPVRIEVSKNSTGSTFEIVGA